MEGVAQDFLSVAIIAFIIFAIYTKHKGQSMMETLKELRDNLQGGKDE